MKTLPRALNCSLTLISISTVCFFGSLAKAIDATPPPEALWGSDGIEVGLLSPNGPTYAIFPSQGPVSLRLFVPAGFLEQEAKERGAALGLAQIFTNLGNQLGLPLENQVMPHATLYKIDGIPTNRLNQEIDALHRIISNDWVASEEVLDAQSCYSEKSSLQRLNESHQAFLYKGTPLAYTASICTDTNVLEGFHASHYQLEDVIIVAAGDLDKEDLKAKLTGYLFHNNRHPHPSIKHLDRKTAFDGVFEKLQHKEPEFGVYIDPDADQMHIFIEALEVLNTEGFSKIQNRVQQTIVKDLQLAIIQKQLDGHFEGSGIVKHWETLSEEPLENLRAWQVHLIVDSEHWEEGLTHVAQIFSDTVYKKRISTKIFDEAKAAVIKKYSLQAEAFLEPTPNLQADVLLEIVKRDIHLSPPAILEKISNTVSQLTLEDCFRAFRELWKNSPGTVFIGGKLPFENKTAAIDAIKTTYYRALAEYNARDTNLLFNYNEFGQPADIEGYQWYGKHGIFDFDFSNGINVHYADNGDALSTLAALCFGQGQLAENIDNKGLVAFSQLAFLRGGLGKHTWEEIETYLLGNEIRLSLIGKDNAFCLQGQAPQGNLLPMLKVMAAYATDPAYRNDYQTEIFRDLKLKKEALGSPEGMIKAYLDWLRNGKDERFEPLLDLSCLDAWDMQRLKEAFDKQLHKGPITLDIVGAYSSEGESGLITSLVNPVWGTLAAVPWDYELENAKNRTFNKSDSIPSIWHYPAQDTNMAIICVAWPMLDKNDRLIFRPIRVLMRLVCNAVKKALREKWGDTYQVTAYSDSGVHVDHGVMALYLKVQKSDIEEAKAILLEAVGNITESFQVRKISFYQQAEALIQQFCDEIKEAIRANGGMPIDGFEGPLRKRLETQIKTILKIVNKPDFSVDDVIFALQGSLAVIGQSLNDIGDRSIDQLQQNLARDTFEFRETIRKLINNKESFEAVMQEAAEFSRQAQSKTAEKKQYYLELSTNYGETNRLAFDIIKVLENLAAEIPPQIRDCQGKAFLGGIREEIMTLLMGLDSKQVRYERKLETALKELLETVREIESQLLEHNFSVVRIEALLEPKRIRLKKLKERTTTCLDQLADLNNKITEYKNDFSTFIESRAENISDESKVQIQILVSDWLENTRSMGRALLANEMLERAQKQMIDHAFTLLNPHYPSDGSINANENDLSKAIKEEVEPLSERSHTAEYWLNNVLRDMRDNPMALSSAENLIENYSNIQVNDLIVLTRLLLSPQRASFLYILPEEI